ncbi:MAG: glycosyltransferase family 2 protein [Chitinispirillales bacterium]|jgi:glycosyltransferase involved in cell wall biosynthesis|nr:glycosyltransferase family 2 protein [Chitinispirillales bacterium]
MKISACWIAKNEVANIKRSIGSLIDIVDELIVVDTGSTDNTVEEVQAIGAVVNHFEWINDFAAARNHAISLASGDIIIFLDADEWFEPRLGSEDRELIVGMFAKNPKLDCISIKIKNIDMASGDVMNDSVVNRIFANRERIRYKGRVHEHLDTPGGINGVLINNRLGINHSGYSRNIIVNKLHRNIGLLDAGLKDVTEGSQNWVRLQMYLVRESFHSGQLKKAAEYLANALRYPGMIKRLCKFHNEEFINNIYIAIWVAFKMRNGVSRREIHQKLVVLFKEAYAVYPGAAEIELLYQVFFNLKEDKFLREFPMAVDAASRLLKKNPGAVSYYKEYERILYEKAALAAWRRSDNLKAMEYSLTALKMDIGNKYHSVLFTILLSSLKGQPSQDIILFLNNIYKFTNTADLNFLINETKRDGFNEVYSWYVKKRMDSGGGSIRMEDYFSLMLVNKAYDLVASNAATLYAAQTEIAGRFLFLAAVCGASPDIISANNDKFGPYSHILDAYYKGERLPKLSGSDSRILQETYSMIAFAAGFQIADKYLNVFRSDPALCFTIKASYCEQSGRPDQVLNEDMLGIDKMNLPCIKIIIQAMNAMGRYASALSETESIMNAEIIQGDFFHTLLVTAEKADGDIGNKARQLYDRYIALYDDIIDLGDVVNTGVVFDNGGEKRKQAFKKMTRDEFDSLLKVEAQSLATKELFELYRKAADIYKQKNVLPEAADCLCRLIAHKKAEKTDLENLAQIFSTLKNNELPQYVLTLEVS